MYMLYIHLILLQWNIIYNIKFVTLNNVETCWSLQMFLLPNKGISRGSGTFGIDRRADEKFDILYDVTFFGLDTSCQRKFFFYPRNIFIPYTDLF